MLGLSIVDYNKKSFGLGRRKYMPPANVNQTPEDKELSSFGQIDHLVPGHALRKHLSWLEILGKRMAGKDVHFFAMHRNRHPKSVSLKPNNLAIFNGLKRSKKAKLLALGTVPKILGGKDWKIPRVDDDIAESSPSSPYQECTDSRDNEVEDEAYADQCCENEHKYTPSTDFRQFFLVPTDNRTYVIGMIERLIIGPLFTNTYILATGKKECLIIDPGPDSVSICKNLDRINFVPNTILLTHGHIDHTAGSLGIQQHYAERGVVVQVGIHEADAPYLSLDSHSMNRSFLPSDNAQADQIFDAMYTALPEPDFFLEDNMILESSGLHVLHTPGHTNGSVCFYDEAREAIFTGDTLFFDAVGRTDFPGADEERMIQSIDSRILVLPASTRIFPGHGPNSTIEREQRDIQYKTNHSML